MLQKTREIMTAMNREIQVKIEKITNSRCILREKGELLSTGRDREGKGESKIILRLHCDTVS